MATKKVASKKASTKKAATKAITAQGLIKADVVSINQRIHVVCGQRVMLDSDLAELYGVQTKVFNQAVQRNIKRFPEDFMFQLTEEEHESLRSQFVTSNAKRGGRRYLPYVFTEQGVAMLSSVLNSERAIEVNIEIMRAFVGLRKIMSSHEQLAAKVEQLEKKYDKQFAVVFQAIKQMMEIPVKQTRKIGFKN